jgi:hypothetical protein
MSVHGTTSSPGCLGGNIRIKGLSMATDANPAAPLTTSRRDIGSDKTHLEAGGGCGLGLGAAQPTQSYPSLPWVANPFFLLVI